jgi:hypothetical protein
MRRDLGVLADELARGRGGSVLLAGPTGVALSFHIDSFSPWAGTQRDKRETSGAVALVRALGLVLEAAREEDLPSRRAARSALVEAQQDQVAVGRRMLALTLASSVLAFFSMPWGETAAGAWSSAAAVVAISPVLVTLVRCRLRFEKLVTRPPDAADRVIFRPPPEGIGELRTHLQLGERDVVLVDDGGTERWIPGPAAGGAVACRIGEATTTWSDVRGAPLLILATDQLAPDGESRKRLERACATAGIEVAADGFSPDGAPLDLRHEIVEPGLAMSDWERGRISSAVDVLVPVAWLLHAMGAVIVAGSVGPWGFSLLAVSLVWIGIGVWAGARYRGWRRRVRRRARARPLGGGT